MESFFSKMLSGLEIQLENSLKEKQEQRFHHCAQLVHEALLKTRAYIREHPFSSREKEIHYFKELAPRLYSKLFYYLKLARIESERQMTGKEWGIARLKEAIRELDDFYQSRKDFCYYYQNRQTHIDEQLFTRHNGPGLYPEEITVIMSEDCCVGSYWAAQLLCNRELRIKMEEMLQEIENPAATTLVAEDSGFGLQWTGSNTDLAELLYSLYLVKVFNKGKATFSQIVRVFEMVLGVKLDNHNQYVQEIWRRKEPAAFGNRLVAATEKKAQDRD